MADINEFNSAFKFFLKENIFKVSNIKLSLKQLQDMHDHLVSCASNSSHSGYEIHLNNVQLVPYHLEELIKLNPSRPSPSSPLSLSPSSSIFMGPPNEEELPKSLRSRVNSNMEDRTLSILENLESSRYFKKISSEYPAKKIEDALLILFEVVRWKTIKLEYISLLGEDKQCLNYRVISTLYNNLMPYVNEIKELSLKEVDLINNLPLVNFLDKALNLEILRLTYTCNKKNIFLKSICEVITDHPSLKIFDLNDIFLQKEDYFDLIKLLKNNNYLDEILINTRPKNEALNAIHEELTHQLQARAIENKLATEDSGLSAGSSKIKPSNQKFPVDATQRVRKGPDYVQRSLPIPISSEQRLDRKIDAMDKKINDLCAYLKINQELMEESPPAIDKQAPRSKSRFSW